MKITDINEKNQNLYFVCLEDWSDEMKEAGNHKECWYHKMKEKGLGVKFAEDDNGVIGGMIHYMPIEYSLAEGKDLFFINCIWVHGYKKGRGNFQKKGMGKSLLAAAERDVKDKGAKGMVVWGISLPFWMRASWFKKHGYKKVDKQNGMVLLWKPFTDDAEPPKWVKKPKDISNSLVLEPNKVTVSAFKNGWCAGGNITYERAKRVAEEYSDKVAFKSYDTFEKETIKKWGFCDALFINNKEVRTGPPPSYKKIKRLVGKKVRRMKNEKKA